MLRWEEDEPRNVRTTRAMVLGVLVLWTVIVAVAALVKGRCLK